MRINKYIFKCNGYTRWQEFSKIEILKLSNTKFLTTLIHDAENAFICLWVFGCCLDKHRFNDEHIIYRNMFKNLPLTIFRNQGLKKYLKS